MEEVLEKISNKGRKNHENKLIDIFIVKPFTYIPHSDQNEKTCLRQFGFNNDQLLIYTIKGIDRFH